MTYDEKKLEAILKMPEDERRKALHFDNTTVDDIKANNCLKKLFKRKLRGKFHGILGIKRKGEDYPAFDPYAINEKNFAYELRHKRAIITINNILNLSVNWSSKEPFTRVERNAFNKEILRCARAIGYNGAIDILLTNDPDCSCYYQYQLSDDGVKNL